MSRCPVATLLALLALLAAAVACSGDDGEERAASTTTAANGAAVREEEAANAVTVDMTEYAYAVAGSVRAGTSTVVLSNSGKELHMAGFALLRDGKTLDDVRAALSSEDESAFDAVVERQLDSPGALLSPRQTMELTTPFLEAGTYALMCFVPTVGEPVPHATKGMVASLEVEEGEVDLEPGPDATYTIEDGTIDGPTALDAGRVTLEVRSAGRGPHEVIVARKRSSTTTFEEIDQAFNDLFSSEAPPPPGYADALPGVLVGNSFDVPGAATVHLTVRLEPGHYLIGCARDPDEGAAEGEAHGGELVEVEVA